MGRLRNKTIKFKLYNSRVNFGDYKCVGFIAKKTLTSHERLLCPLLVEGQHVQLVMINVMIKIIINHNQFAPLVYVQNGSEIIYYESDNDDLHV